MALDALLLEDAVHCAGLHCGKSTELSIDFCQLLSIALLFGCNDLCWLSAVNCIASLGVVYRKI